MHDSPRSSSIASLVTIATAFSTLNNAWIQIKEETDSIAKRHNELAEALDAQVATPITTTIKEYKKKREKLKLDGRKLIKDLGEAEKKKDAAKAAYDSARRALDEAKEKYEQATHNNAQTPQIEKVPSPLDHPRPRSKPRVD